MPTTTFNSFQQVCVRDISYPNQGKGSTLGMSMCLAAISANLGDLSESFKCLVEHSEMQHSNLHGRQEFLDGRKLETVEAIGNILSWVACYAHEWGFQLEDIITGKAAQPGTVAGYLEGEVVDQ